MTNWFVKLNITEEDIKENFLKCYLKPQSKTLPNIDSICFNKNKSAALLNASYPQHFNDDEFICTPFYIASTHRKGWNDSIINALMHIGENISEWAPRIPAIVFLLTPKEYYELFMSKCKGEEKEQYLQELQEIYEDSIRKEISMITDKEQEIKNKIDNEIAFREKMLKLGALQTIFNDTGLSINDIHNCDSNITKE